jgi:hypothetical protein
MNLLTKLKTEVLDPLAASWGALFAKHGLDITKPLNALATELERPLPIDRTIPGFEDFALGAYRAIEPGKPGLSLIYHALASPGVIPSGTKVDFPTLAQLDLVENYVYSRVHAQIGMFNDPVVAVFAYQYRQGDRTTHRAHADLAFSRTGISRVGNEPALYVEERRGFEPRPSADRGFRVLPARYAAFIAERRPQAPNGSVMRAVPGDSSLTFLFPVHKLFSGSECLFELASDGNEIPLDLPELRFIERHLCEKLARIHNSEDNLGYIPALTKPSFDLSTTPFTRDSRVNNELVSLSTIGASVLVEAVAQPLVSIARQMVSGKEEVARFVVPAPNTVHGRKNRYWSTFEIPADGDSRAAPEYVNIRTEVSYDSHGVILTDVNQLPSGDFEQKIGHGGYEAAHIIDNSCDGALTIEPISALGAIPFLPAYSLITAIDYFPGVDQVQIEEWLENRSGRSIGTADIERQFPQGGPQPMSDGRFEWRIATADLSPTRQLPNCTLPHPDRSGARAFSLADPANYTATAVVGAPPSSKSIGAAAPLRNCAPTWLPDAASDVFAPGWDVSQHQYANQNMYVAYGLGSPFPEDAKLCAALNSFWPAVAPDSARTYGWRPPIPWSRMGNPLTTAIPLTDAELGYHSGHPRVVTNEVKASFGWDGDHGPFLVTVAGNRFADASNPLRADQTRAALEGRLGFSGLDAIDATDFIRRMEALRWCRQNIDANGFDVGAGWLIAFEMVDDWALWNSTVWPKANSKLSGPGMIFLFASTLPGTEVGNPPMRKRFPVQQTLEIQMSDVSLFADIKSVRDDAVEPIVYFRLDSNPFGRHGEVAPAPLITPTAVAAVPQIIAGRSKFDTTTRTDSRLPE